MKIEVFKKEGHFEINLETTDGEVFILSILALIITSSLCYKILV